MPKTYTFYSDPSHSWVKVPLAELIDLGVAGEISASSYVRGDSVYLEEDRDAYLWASAYEDKHGTAPEITESHTDHRSHVRNYNRFSKHQYQ